MSSASLVPRARRASRGVVLAALAAGLPGQRAGARTQQAIVLAALALGMPHGAADTELLRAASGGRRARHAVLLATYAGLAGGATAVVRRGGPWVERGVLAASALHFAEGELACWPAPPGGARPARLLLRAATAAVTTVLLPAAVGTAAGAAEPEVGATAALRATPSRATGSRTGLTTLRAGRGRASVGPLAGAGLLGTVALAATGDGVAAADSALLVALDLLAPPATAFAAYFGGWHALRHTARVLDALAEGGRLPPQAGLAHGVALLGRRSAWAATAGVLAMGALALRDPERASDNAFAAVLGLTVPHMLTVAAELSTGRVEKRPW